MSSDDPQKVKQNLLLSDVARDHTRLTQKGSKWIGSCPLPTHDDKTPSFQVDDARGVFHCFGCNSHGDHFDLIQKIKGVDFQEALTQLAERAGVALSNSRSPKTRSLRNELLAINSAAVEFYERQLRNNPDAISYLKDRGIKEPTIRLFKLGATKPSQWDALYKHLKGQFKDDTLMKSGLFKRSKKGVYDLLRGRVIFPIRDVQGRTIGFGGRVLPATEKANQAYKIPKYLNSPETLLFKKSQNLYNLDFAKAYLKKNIDAVVVEGYLDVLSCYQAGVTSVVAPLGTAFTEDQAKLLKRHTHACILNFDSDAAGDNAVNESLPGLLKANLDIKVASLQNEMDPDEFIRKHGVSAYQNTLATAQDFYRFLFQLHAGDKLSEDPRAKSQLATKMLDHIRHVQEPIMREHYLGQLAFDLKVRNDVLSEQMALTHGNAMAGFQRKGLIGKVDSSIASTNGSKASSRTKRFELTSTRQKFLYHVMCLPKSFETLPLIQKKLLPQLVHHHFGKLLDKFVFASTDLSLENRMQLAPQAYQKGLQIIATASITGEKIKLDEVIQDLAREMALERTKPDRGKTVNFQNRQHSGYTGKDPSPFLKSSP
jgi:DNA primase